MFYIWEAEMALIKNCQMSIFGSYEGIVPESELVRKLADALKEYEFIPGTIDVGFFDSSKGEASIGKRIHMVSDDGCWKINIMMERINFTYSYKEGTKEYSRINNVCDAALKFSECVFSVLGEIRGRRLALNCKVPYELTDDDIRKLILKDTMGISQYKEGVQRQLLHLVNTAVIEFGNGKTEESNVVFKTEVDARKSEKRLIITCDINTLAENKQLKFVPEDLNMYVVAAREKISGMLLDFQSFMER